MLLLIVKVLIQVYGLNDEILISKVRHEHMFSHFHIISNVMDYETMIIWISML